MISQYDIMHHNLNERVKVQKCGYVIRHVKSKGTRYIRHACIDNTDLIALEITERTCNDCEVKRSVARKIVSKLKLDDMLIVDRLDSS